MCPYRCGSLTCLPWSGEGWTRRVNRHPLGCTAARRWWLISGSYMAADVTANLMSPMTPLSLTSTPSGKLHLLPDVQISGISHLRRRVRKGIVTNDSTVIVSLVPLNFSCPAPSTRLLAAPGNAALDYIISDAPLVSSLVGSDAHLLGLCNKPTSKITELGRPTGQTIIDLGTGGCQKHHPKHTASTTGLKPELDAGGHRSWQRGACQ